MAINKFQRSRLTFDLSAKVADSDILETHQTLKHSFFQKPLGQLNSNFIWRLLKLRGVNLYQMLMIT